MKQQQTMNPAHAGRPIYFINNRPESYEYWGEVSHERVEQLAGIIAENAARRFPGIDFRIDSEWHSHDAQTSDVLAYIKSDWLTWAKSSQALEA